jgi:ubiquinone biosynthesis protein UbiJ
MALFFDRPWFEEKLTQRGLTHADMAAIGDVSAQDLTLMFKDQMEVAHHQVQAWAQMLGETTKEVAHRCGVSTPVVAVRSDAQRIAALEARIAALESQIQDLTRRQDAKS